MKHWTRPDCYVGAEWPEMFVFLGQHRDSDILTRSNFRSALKKLGGESDTVQVIRESHWAVGWVEWIGIHEGDSKAIAIAENIEESLESYPVVDESDWSELETEEIEEYWTNCSMKERIEYCAENKESIFAARQAWPPERVFDRLRDILQ